MEWNLVPGALKSFRNAGYQIAERTSRNWGTRLLISVLQKGTLKFCISVEPKGETKLYIWLMFGCNREPEFRFEFQRTLIGEPNFVISDRLKFGQGMVCRPSTARLIPIRFLQREWSADSLWTVRCPNFRASESQNIGLNVGWSRNLNPNSGFRLNRNTNRFF